MHCREAELGADEAGTGRDDIPTSHTVDYGNNKSVLQRV